MRRPSFSSEEDLPVPRAQVVGSAPEPVRAFSLNESNHFFSDAQPIVSSLYPGSVSKFKMVLRRLYSAINMVTIMVRFPVEAGDVCLLVRVLNGAGTYLGSY